MEGVYRTALREEDRKHLVAAVRLAELAIQARFQEVEGMAKAGAERAALKTAIKDLQAIKAEYRLP
jgi:hypothetical protein